MDDGYARLHAAELRAPHVELAGELSGLSKLRELRHASVLVYSCAPEYVEAGAAVFGEALRSGTPVAALVWREGTCAQAALCERTGVVVQADGSGGEDEAMAGLADAIVAAERLDAREVQEVGFARFDPDAHFRILASGTAR
jgi:hypothetical protein